MMPSMIHKTDIIKALRESMPPDILDLMIGREGVQGFLTPWYSMMNNMAGALELAYRRGYQAGQESESDDG